MRTGSLHLGRLFGIPVRVHWSLLVFLLFVAIAERSLAGVLSMVLVFGSVVVHELAHALVARGRGLPIGDISLYPFGGVAKLLSPPKTSRDEIVVAVAGPAASLALAFSFLALSPLGAVAATLARVNLMLGVFNLLPALPMDGGRVLRALLARRLGFYGATRRAARLSRWIAFGLMGAAFFTSAWLAFLGLLVLVLASAEEASARMREYMGDPGYTDTPGPARFDPLAWLRRPVRGRREIRDARGNWIVVEWWDSSQSGR